MQPCRLPRRCHLPGQRCQAGGVGGLWGHGWEHPQNGVLRAACHAVGLPVGFWGGGWDPAGRKEAPEPGRSPAFLYGVVGTRHHLGTGWAARAVTPPGCVPLRVSLPPIAQRGVCVGPTETRVEVLAVGLGRGWHGSAAPEGLLGTTCGQEGDTPCPFCPLPFPPVQGGGQDLFWVLGGGSCPPLRPAAGPLWVPWPERGRCQRRGRSNVPLFSWGHKGLQSGRARRRGAAARAGEGAQCWGGGTAPAPQI